MNTRGSARWGIEAWQPAFVDKHPAHRVLAEAHAPFSSATEWPSLASWNAVGPISPRFVADRKRPRRARGPRAIDTLYDAKIAQDDAVPSREGNWHDYLNMLVWRTCPKTKRALHTAQYEALRNDLGSTVIDRLPNARSRQRDRLTMFDEGGLVRVAFDGMTRYVLFGHALHEHLLRGHIGPLRAAFCDAGCISSLEALDMYLSQWIRDAFSREEERLPEAVDLRELDATAWWTG